MRTIFTLIITIVLIIMNMGVEAQNTLALKEDLKNELSSSQLAILKEADEINAKANVIFNKSEEINNEVVNYRKEAKAATTISKEKSLNQKADNLLKKVLEKRMEASILFEKANDLTRDVYFDKLKGVRPKEQESGRYQRGIKYEREAKSLFQDAKLKRIEFVRKKEKMTDEQLIQLLDEIQKNDMQGFDKLLVAFGIYLEWEKVLAPDTTVRNLPDTIIVQNDKNTPKKNGKNQTTNNTPNPLPDEIINPTDYTRGIVFRVQIFASKNKPNPEVLSRIYNGTEKIVEETENGWFKYVIGNFRKYEDAKTLKDKLKQKDNPFVVAYKDNIRYDLMRALQEAQ